MPLAGRRFVVAGPGAIADECAALLQALDGDVVRVARVTAGLASAGVEGAIDALSRRCIARHRDECAAVLGVYSASTPCVGLPLDLLAGRRVVLALDDDAGGERASAVIGDSLRGVAAELFRERPPNGAKGWNATIVKVST